ncbi:MAG: hypothetical protein JOZ56_09200 [Actinobacteria bacterium]|nr:hypothetical protein [Actinomycetota bacterium]MBV8563251.1 hypothetical protein [Actinomycetota bacterium]
MHRVIVLYDHEPDEAEYAEHVKVCQAVPNGVFRHGRITGAPMGEPKHAYFAEWEFADEDAFNNAVRSEEFMASGKDAYKRGLPQPTVEFLELS